MTSLALRTRNGTTTRFPCTLTKTDRPRKTAEQHAPRTARKLPCLEQPASESGRGQFVCGYQSRTQVQGPFGFHAAVNGEPDAAADNNGRANSRTTPIVSFSSDGAVLKRLRRRNAAHCFCLAGSDPNASLSPTGSASIPVSRCRNVAAMPAPSVTPSNGVSHFAPLQRPEEFNAAVLDFVAKVLPTDVSDGGS